MSKKTVALQGQITQAAPGTQGQVTVGQAVRLMSYTDMKLTCSIKHVRLREGKIKWRSDFRVLFGDVLVCTGSCYGKATETYLLEELGRQSPGTLRKRGWFPCSKGYDMARSAGLLS